MMVGKTSVDIGVEQDVFAGQPRGQLFKGGTGGAVVVVAGPRGTGPVPAADGMIGQDGWWQTTADGRR